MKKILSIALAMIILLIQTSALAVSYTATVKEQGVRLRDSSGQVIREIPINTRITVNSYNSKLDMFSVAYNGKNGYIKGTGLDITKAQLLKNVSATPTPTKAPTPKPSKTTTPKPTQEPTPKPITTPFVSANRSTEEMLFLGMNLGTTSLNTAKAELERQQLVNNYTVQNTAIRSPISCQFHSDDARAIGFPTEECAYGTGRYIWIIYDSAHGWRSSPLSIGGMQVHSITLNFAGYSYLYGNVTEIKYENNYWLYSGQYEFEFQGSSSKQSSKNAYDTLAKKLTNIYGEPAAAFDSVSSVVAGYNGDNPYMQNKSAYHTIWLGANNTGIILSYEPSVHVDSTVRPRLVEERYLVHLTYGLTSMNDFIATVNSYTARNNSREGL